MLYDIYQSVAGNMNWGLILHKLLDKGLNALML